MIFPPETDARLIKKALSGSQRAWVNLVTRYEERVYNYALRMTRNSNDAMDLMQDVFLTVFRSLPNYRGDSAFNTWLFRIIANRTTDFYRKQQRQPGMDSVDVDTLSATGGPMESFSHLQRNQAIKALLDQLPGEQRIVVELKFFQHFTFEEIAGQLGLSPNTIKSRLYAAMKKLKTALEVSHAI